MESFDIYKPRSIFPFIINLNLLINLNDSYKAKKLAPVNVRDLVKILVKKWLELDAKIAGLRSPAPLSAVPTLIAINRQKRANVPTFIFYVKAVRSTLTALVPFLLVTALKSMRF